MKTTVVDRRTVESNLGKRETQDFTFAVNRKSFRVIFDTIYTDKPLAVVREICTNAYDSHIAAGKKDIPFDLHLPSMMSHTLTVRDYGVSMTHEEVMHLYSTVFASSKDEGDNANDFVGMLGIGSKSPFSYVDSFSVVAYLDGEARSYVASLGTSGTPSITHIDTFDTDEPNGIKVSLPVQIKHFGEFKEAARKVIIGFDTPPNIDGGDKDLQASLIDRPIFAEGNWKIYKNRPNAVKQGCVIYPIPEHQLRLQQITGYNYGVTVEVPIGTVEVAASREALSFDDTTKEVVLGYFVKAGRDIHEYVEKNIDDAPNRLEAEKRYMEWKNSIYITGDVIYKKNGPKPYKLTGYIECKDINISRLDSNWEPIRTMLHFAIQDIPRLEVIVDHSDQKVIRKRLRVRQYRAGYGNKQKMLICDPNPKQLAKFVKRIGLQSHQLVSVCNLPDNYVPRHSGGSIPTHLKRTGTYYLSAYNGNADYLARVYEDKLVKDFYWVEIGKGNDEGAIIDELGYWRNNQIGQLYDQSIQNLFLKEKPLYFLTKQAVKKANVDNKLVTVVNKTFKDNKVKIFQKVETLTAVGLLTSSGIRSQKVLDTLLNQNGVQMVKPLGYLPERIFILKDKSGYEASKLKGTQAAEKLIEKFPMLFKTASEENYLDYIKIISKKRGK